MDFFPPVSAAAFFCNTSFTFAKGSFPGIVSFSLEWLPDFFQDKFSPTPEHYSLSGLVLSAYSIRNDRKAGENEVILHTADGAPSAKYVFVNEAFFIGWCFVIGWSVHSPSLFLVVIWEEM